jgi:hypothetical protein
MDKPKITIKNENGEIVQEVELDGINKKEKPFKSFKDLLLLNGFINDLKYEQEKMTVAIDYGRVEFNLEKRSKIKIVDNSDLVFRKSNIVEKRYWTLDCGDFILTFD